MKYITRALLTSFVSLTFLNGCRDKAEPEIIISELNTNHAEAVGPYFTQDHKGKQVLCWTERDPKDSLFILKYAVYNTRSNSFSTPVTVSASKGMSTSPESMGKVGFKSDGTVFAVFAKPFKGEKNPFAGAIYYSFSNDNGANWSEQRFLHSDTSHHYGRSFFDITRLKTGELGVIWLDGRLGKSIKGSSLFFASTQKGSGFENERCLAKGTCECCRTDIVTDKNGNIHIAYRNILFPNPLLGEQVRDMVYSISKDNGITFSQPQLISKDNWKIEGCPHSGPSLAVNGATVNAVWFTAGGTSGLYYTSSTDSKSDFRVRTLLSIKGRHPQMVNLSDGKQAVIYEESTSIQPEHSTSSSRSHKGIENHQSSSASARIVLNILADNKEIESISITDSKQPDHHAVLTRLDNILLAAWIREEDGQSKIYYSLVKGN